MAGGGESKGAVLAALVCNVILTTIKFIAFAISGSGSMFSEAMHTLADAGNQALLFVGIKRSERAPDAMFSYGYGGERFLFALLSAVGIFVLGCGVTVYHGISSLLRPHPLHIGWLDFVVLGLGFFMDGFVLWKAVKAINQVRGKTPFFKFLRTTSDPTIAAVLLEDGVACLGVVIALLGITLSWLTRSHVFDALGRIFIGGLLGLVAVWLGYKNRSLILGRSIPKEAEEKLIAYLKEQPSVESVHAVQSRVVGADCFKLKADIDWNGRWFGEQLHGWATEQKGKLDSADGTKEFTREFGEHVAVAIGAEIDRIEKALRELVPELRYVDLENH
ncbi:MAG: cation diffusion facilitator family transporter [Planctomycetes bacterium]|nr:cation diffusion facilitator family transporter [Planctomycetota bacterium]